MIKVEGVWKESPKSSCPHTRLVTTGKKKREKKKE